MNERIHELYQQAHMIRKYPADDPMRGGNPPTVYWGGEDSAKKFAELIVKECIEQCSKVLVEHTGQPSVTHNYAVKLCQDSIKKHFGVNEMKPCPFCGHAVDLADPDTLYPNGIGWKGRPNGHYSYHNYREVPQEQWCYSIHCVTTSGGCGVEISGDSRQECIDKWNRRV